MQYFDVLPKVVYNDINSSQLYINLMARVSVMPEMLANPLNYYKYDIRDGDTPELIANKYYGDSYRYWIVLFANKMLDPQWDWPMTQEVFEKYIKKKYGRVDSRYIVHHYEKIIEQYEVNTQTTSSNILTIDKITYDNIVEETNRVLAASGPLNITITKKAVSLFDYEFDVNEQKRTINILNSAYVNQFEKQLKDLMAK